MKKTVFIYLLISLCNILFFIISEPLLLLAIFIITSFSMYFLLISTSYAELPKSTKVIFAVTNGISVFLGISFVSRTYYQVPIWGAILLGISYSLIVWVFVLLHTMSRRNQL